MTLFEAYKSSLKKLPNPDVDEINVRIILCEINHLDSMSDFYLQKDEEIRDLPLFQSYFERFLNGEPVQYILGKTTFLGREFLVDKRVLIPRQESEEVVDFAIKKTIDLFGPKQIDVIDVCCGSGIMGITFAKCLNVSHLYFSDISNDALDVCKLNCKKFDVDGLFYKSDALDELIKNNIKVDVLVSNPPYILKREKIDKSVLDYEPHLALFSDDQFSVYKRIISNLDKIKKDTLLAVFEIGTYSKQVLEQYIQNEYPSYEYGFIKDMNNKERILYLIVK